jgi:hypothetical protein
MFWAHYYFFTSFQLAKTKVGLQVEETSLRKSEMIGIHFPAEHSIYISLRPEDLKGRSAEAVNFQDGLGGWWVY